MIATLGRSQKTFQSMFAKELKLQSLANLHNWIIFSAEIKLQSRKETLQKVNVISYCLLLNSNYGE